MPLTGPSLRRQVEALFDVVPNRCTAEELVFICPNPACGDRSGNRSVGMKNGRTNCWRCNTGGDFVRWARYLGYAVDDEGAAEPDINAADAAMSAVDHEKTIIPVVSNCRLPRGYTPIAARPDSVYSQAIAEMAEAKHLSRADFERAQVGFTKLDPTWEPYAIFPIFEWGKVVYFQGRLYSARPGEATKRFPRRADVPLGSKYWVYNLDAARQAETVIIVESILNVLSLERQLAREGLAGVVPVCVFKHAVSVPQLAKLMALKSAKEFCFFFDADATAESWRFAEQACNHRRVTVAEMPAVGGCKTFDANDDAKLAVECFRRRRRADAPSEALSKLLESL